MKWVVAVLVVMNVGLYLWATGHQQPDAPKVRPVINARGMRLLNEHDASQDARQKASCFRIGPFANQAGSADAVAKLKELSVPHTALTVKMREVRAYRVYLGPFSTQEQIAGQRDELRKNGVNEHYVKSEANNEDVISLGLFSQRGRAEDFLRELGGKKIVAKIRPENRTLGPTYWLELRDTDTNQAVLGALREARWAGEEARLRSFPCS